MNLSVSVIIPTYNRGHLLCDAINSVLDQDIENCEIEIIVVDDGSTDETSTKIKQFGSRVRYVYQENAGAGAARNRGIEEAKNEWIAFLDSDDLWLPQKLSLQFRVLDALPGYKIIHTNFYTSEHNQIIIKDGLGYWLYCSGKPSVPDWAFAYSERRCSSEFEILFNNKQFPIYTGNIFRPFLKLPLVQCGTMLIHKECFKPGVRFAEDFSTWEDYWFQCKLSEHYDIIFLDVATMDNRSHSGPRLTSAETARIIGYHIDICKRIYISSKSIHRPSDEEIEEQIGKLQLSLAREYIKRGMRLDALEALKIAFSLGAFTLDRKGFILASLALLLPFKLFRMFLAGKELLATKEVRTLIPRNLN